MKLNKEEIKKVAEMKMEEAFDEMRNKRYFGLMNRDYYVLFRAANKSNKTDNAKYEIVELEVNTGRCGYGVVVTAKSNKDTINREFDCASAAFAYIVALRKFEKEED